MPRPRMQHLEPRSGAEIGKGRGWHRWTNAAAAVATIIASLMLFLLIAEVACRLLPVRSGLQVQGVDTAHPFISFTPNSEFVFSDGSLLTNVNHGHVNNCGFVNDQDYDPDDRRP